VFNKADLPDAVQPRPAVEGSYCLVTALTGQGVPELLGLIGDLLQAQQERLQVRIPASRSDLLAELHRAGRVAEQSLDDGAFAVTAYVPAKIAGRIRKALAGVAAEG